MTDHLDRARNELRKAAESAERAEQEQFHSIDEGLMELVEGDKTQDAPVQSDRLAELEEKLDGLREKTDGETQRHVANAAAAIDEVRKERTDEGE